ncbi:MAG: hypothetical protein AAF998_19470 [Bacteroidota bacterium]
MATEKSYTITLRNNDTEKSGIRYLVNQGLAVVHPDSKSRKSVLEFLGLENRFRRSFDLILFHGQQANNGEVELKEGDAITLIELKTTKKFLPNNPRGFFVGVTENELDLARLLGDQFRFCFVSLHPESLSPVMLPLSEMEGLIKTKRTQYQVNLIK